MECAFALDIRDSDLCLILLRCQGDEGCVCGSSILIVGGGSMDVVAVGSIVMSFCAT